MKNDNRSVVDKATRLASGRIMYGSTTSVRMLESWLIVDCGTAEVNVLRTMVLE
jgi:hypothetical protein